jgi:hypothetical protein
MSGDKPALHPAVAIGFALFMVSLLAWLWLGEWRWAVTGLAVLLITAVVSNVRRTDGRP